MTRAWCARLREHLENPLAAQANARYPGKNAAQSVHEHVLNLEYDCTRDEGKSTDGYWACRWNETFDTSEKCKELRDRR